MGGRTLHIVKVAYLCCVLFTTYNIISVRCVHKLHTKCFILHKCKWSKKKEKGGIVGYHMVYEKDERDIESQLILSILLQSYQITAENILYSLQRLSSTQSVAKIFIPPSLNFSNKNILLSQGDWKTH